MGWRMVAQCQGQSQTCYKGLASMNFPRVTMG